MMQLPSESSADTRSASLRAFGALLAAGLMCGALAADAQPRRAGNAAAKAAPARAACPAFERSPSAMRAHMAFLADDLLQGRAPGTPGYDIAANYVAAQLSTLGLKPAGDRGTFLQRVPLIEYRARGEQRFSVRGPGRYRAELRHGREFTFGGWPVQPHVELTAPLAFAGYGIVAPDGSRDDYAALDVRGKIVIVLDGAPGGLPGDERAHHSTAWAKHALAAQRGAAGLLLLRLPTTVEQLREQLRAANAAAQAGRDHPWTMSWKSPADVPHAAGGRLVPVGTLTAAGAAKLFRQAPVSIEQLVAAAAAPQGRTPSFALPMTATVSLHSETRDLSSSNVAGLIEGADPSLRNEIVVLSAHLDHLGVRKTGSGDAIYNGAIDNASGIATLIEVARGFQRSARRPRRSILLLAVTAEEKGLLGSQYFAHHPTVPKASIVANVNLDMPILTHDFSDMVAFGAERSTIGQSVRRAASCLGVGLSSDPLPEQGLFTRSDHYRFVQQGIPSVFLMTGVGKGGRAALQGFLSGCYHKVCDDMTQPISFDAAARFAHLNFAIATELANARERPRWREGDFFGRLFAPASQERQASRGKARR
jgi:hypothetical protein